MDEFTLLIITRELLHGIGQGEMVRYFDFMVSFFFVLRIYQYVRLTYRDIFLTAKNW